MKSVFHLFLIVVVMIASASAFAPMPQQRTQVTSLSASNNIQIPEALQEKKAAIAAFATAVAPVAAANAVDESVVIGYGAGLVACVVSLAVGFAIGYGTLAKL